MQKRRQSVRKENSTTAEVDKILNSANAHWNNRRKKIAESPDYSEDMVLRYKNAMKRFQLERRKKRQAHKNGEITFKQLQDWACLQQEEAERVLQDLITEESKKS